MQRAFRRAGAAGPLVEGTPPLVWLKAVSGPGDEGEPVLTVMLPKRPGAKPRKIALTKSDRPLARVTAALVTMALTLLVVIGTAH